MLDKVELLVSAYDTAWVAMVSSPRSPKTRCFTGSINCILENQLQDALSSTFSCVLAFKTWHVVKIR
ncbi:hypothetical protein Nepgr_015329 [Nepenthes gracilis]|uniref:Uncharacterized protein n=1 Tax=Nepenthes gracilis TaxID=150966 RepID=A0AAD3SKX5_NEPGR|nr:hypothetical protein Nepgr_015329 [Nepenthes gracilis]